MHLSLAQVPFYSITKKIITQAFFIIYFSKALFVFYFTRARFSSIIIGKTYEVIYDEKSSFAH